MSVSFVVFRYLYNSQKKKIEPDSEAKNKFYTMKHHCGRDDVIDGAMIGWSPKEIALLSK